MYDIDNIIFICLIHFECVNKSFLTYYFHMLWPDTQIHQICVCHVATYKAG